MGISQLYEYESLEMASLDVLLGNPKTCYMYCICPKCSLCQANCACPVSKSCGLDANTLVSRCSYFKKRRLHGQRRKKA